MTTRQIGKCHEYRSSSGHSLVDRQRLLQRTFAHKYTLQVWSALAMPKRLFATVPMTIRGGLLAAILRMPLTYGVNRIDAILYPMGVGLNRDCIQ